MTVLDSVSLAVVKTIPVGVRPRGIVLTLDHRDVLVCNGDDGTISVINAEKLEVVGALDAGSDPETLALSPDGSVSYVSNEDDSMVTMLRRADGETIARVPVGIEPEGLAVSADGKTVVDVSESTNWRISSMCSRRRWSPTSSSTHVRASRNIRLTARRCG